eukprot:ANDGO_05940.mRNA.1 hypothetical protein
MSGTNPQCADAISRTASVDDVSMTMANLSETPSSTRKRKSVAFDLANESGSASNDIGPTSSGFATPTSNSAGSADDRKKKVPRITAKISEELEKLFFAGETYPSRQRSEEIAQSLLIDSAQRVLTWFANRRSRASAEKKKKESVEGIIAAFSGTSNVMGSGPASGISSEADDVALTNPVEFQRDINKGLEELFALIQKKPGSQPVLQTMLEFLMNTLHPRIGAGYHLVCGMSSAKHSAFHGLSVLRCHQVLSIASEAVTALRAIQTRPSIDEFVRKHPTGAPFDFVTADGDRVTVRNSLDAPILVVWRRILISALKEKSVPEGFLNEMMHQIANYDVHGVMFASPKQQILGTSRQPQGSSSSSSSSAAPAPPSSAPTTPLFQQPSTPQIVSSSVPPTPAAATPSNTVPDSPFVSNMRASSLQFSTPVQTTTNVPHVHQKVERFTDQDQEAQRIEQLQELQLQKIRQQHQQQQQELLHQQKESSIENDAATSLVANEEPSESKTDDLKQSVEVVTGATAMDLEPADIPQVKEERDSFAEANASATIADDSKKLVELGRPHPIAITSFSSSSSLSGAPSPNQSEGYTPLPLQDACTPMTPATPIPGFASASTPSSSLKPSLVPVEFDSREFRILSEMYQAVLLSEFRADPSETSFRRLRLSDEHARSLFSELIEKNHFDILFAVAEISDSIRLARQRFESSLARKSDAMTVSIVAERASQSADLDHVAWAFSEAKRRLPFIAKGVADYLRNEFERAGFASVLFRQDYAPQEQRSLPREDILSIRKLYSADSLSQGLRIRHTPDHFEFDAETFVTWERIFEVSASRAGIDANETGQTAVRCASVIRQHSEAMSLLRCTDDLLLALDSDGDFGRRTICDSLVVIRRIVHGPLFGSSISHPPS